MRVIYFVTGLMAAALLSRGVAEENYSFGPVPPPSIFSTNTPPAFPVVAGTATNAVTDQLPATITNAVPRPRPVPPAVAAKKSRGKPKFEPLAETPAPPKARSAPAEILPAVPVPVVAVTNLIITAGSQYNGMVLAVDPEMRFVVLNYSLGWLPGQGQEITVYRHGLKVGTVKISGPQRDDNVTADITAGELKVGDEARVN